MPQPVGLSLTIISQSLFATRFANCNFSLPNKSNLTRFSKAFCSENYHLALSGEKHLATVFTTFIEKSTIGWVTSKPRNSKTVNPTKTSAETAHRQNFRYTPLGVERGHRHGVTHPSTDRARRRLTSLIKTNALPLRQTATKCKRTYKTGVVGNEIHILLQIYCCIILPNVIKKLSRAYTIIARFGEI